MAGEIEEVEESASLSWKTEDYYGGSPTNLHYSESSWSSSPPSPSLNKLLLFDMGLEKKSKIMMMMRDEEKWCWLRSQLVGAGVELDTPFGKPILTYADHTASGRSLRYVESFIIQSVLPFYGNTHTSDSHVGARMTGMAKEAGEYIKRCMGGGENDVLLFCGSGTTAAIKRLQEMMGIAVPSTLRERVIRSLMRNEERWVVFVGPYEHHSNLLSWRQSLAEVVEIGCNSEGQVDMDAIKHALESSEYSNRPMLGSFSACSNVTGMHADTRAISRLLHQHGAFACFDFAASGPYAKIDMRSGEEDGYDGVFLSPHKFVGGPGSPGILLVSKALYQLQSSPPTTCGGGTVAYVNGFNEKDTLYYDDIEEREDAGTPPIVQKIRAALAFWIKEFMGYGLISSLDTKHIELALERLLPNPNIHVLGNTGVRRHSILSFLVFSRPATSFFNNMKRESPGGGGKSLLWRDIKSNADMPLHGRFVAKLLNDLFGIQARGGCACSGPYGHRLLNVDKTLSLGLRSAIQRGYGGVKPGWTRVSFPFYMSTEEVEFIAAAIGFVAEYGHCFLPLYRFNWRSGDWSFRKSMHSVVSMLLRSKEHSNLSTGISQLTVHPARDRSDASVNEKNNGRDYNTGLSKKHALCLEAARNIVDALLDFPLARKVPKDIDLSIVLFRI